MGKLTLVPTPVGNLADMTYRAVEVLGSVQLILAEDTRTSGVLLKHYGITTPQRSYHMHNEHAVVEQLVEQLRGESHFALVTDAGTPGISDPGFLLVRACLRAGVEVEALPGATAFVPALVASGLPCDRFCFEGFLPLKKGRQTRLSELATEPRTLVFYESPHKLGKTLRDLALTFGPERPACAAREISKKFEEFVRLPLGELAVHFENNPPRGEFVLVVGGADRKG